LQRLAELVAAVTGGGSGIGFSFAKQCHSKGARVLIGDLKLTKEADEYVSKAKDSEIAFKKCDVSSWDDLHNLISVSVKKFSAVPDVYAPVVSRLAICCNMFSDGIIRPAYSNRPGRTSGTMRPTALTKRSASTLTTR
jgi:NAD(P)-dependent dehydrogenase (short-subunit alcohol dehydrogenase family)